MKKFKFLQRVQSHDCCILGKVVMDEKGEHYVAYYNNNKKVQLIKIDYYLHDWELVTPQK